MKGKGGQNPENGTDVKCTRPLGRESGIEWGIVTAQPQAQPQLHIRFRGMSVTITSLFTSAHLSDTGPINKRAMGLSTPDLNLSLVSHSVYKW